MHTIAIAFFQGLDYTYDIYAQWPLEQDAFHQEVARVKALYENAAETDTFYQVLTLEQGPYTCFISDIVAVNHFNV